MSRIIPALAVLAGALAAAPAHAGDHVLVVLVGNDAGLFFYYYGQILAADVQAEAALDDGQVDTFVLRESGPAMPDLSSYDQVWVVDFSIQADDSPNHQAGWTAIEDWWNARTTGGAVIFDSRARSSTTWGHTGEGSLLFGDYYRNLEAAGGGMVLVDGDAPWCTAGIDDLLADLGFDGFQGQYWAFPYLDRVDPASPVVSQPYVASHGANDLYLWANTFESFAPSGAQPNGVVLDPVAWVPNHPGKVVISWATVAPTCSPATCFSTDPCYAATCDPQQGCVQVPLDSDGDGVLDCQDTCPGTAAGALIDANGCSIDDLCPCDGTWSGQPGYLHCVAQTARTFVNDGLMSPRDAGQTVASHALHVCLPSSTGQGGSGRGPDGVGHDGHRPDGHWLDGHL